jgi:hypothetical protein
MFDLFKKKKTPGPDYSTIDSVEKVEALVSRGELEKLLLLPEAFGGEDIPPNIVYVPLGFAAMKYRTDENVVAPLAAEGKVTRYVASPVYAGDSHVPIAIKIKATEPAQFEVSLAIWGEALKGKG